MTNRKSLFGMTRANNIKPSHKKTQTPKKRTIGQPSQRERVDPKTGKATKKPSPRLMTRREKDTIPGYYPNPVNIKNWDIGMQWTGYNAGGQLPYAIVQYDGTSDRFVCACHRQEIAVELRRMLAESSIAGAVFTVVKVGK